MLKKDKNELRTLKKILYAILPNLHARNSNNKIKKQADKSVDLKNVSIEAIKEKYEETTFAKSQLDDKAKTTTAALTVTITLVLNLYGLVKGAMENEGAIWFRATILTLAVTSILYIASAWLLAMSVLFKHNKICRTSLYDGTMAEYHSCITENIKINLMRNNCLYASYLCVRNSVICLIVVFILVFCPYLFNENLIKQENIIYAESLNNWIKENPYETKRIALLVNDNLNVFKKEGITTIYVKDDDIKLMLELEGGKCIVKKVE